MRRAPTFAIVVALLLVCSLAVAAGARSADPGVSSTQILIGGTAPLSGEASSAAPVARGAQAYFESVNAGGGVNGRRIVYKVVDDGYAPSQTVQAVHRLVEEDQVFAIFAPLGTNNNVAIRDYLNGQKVPQLFALSGATTFGADAARYPYTIGFLPTYAAEGAVLARQAVRSRPHGRYGVLYQDDDYGKELLAGLRRGLGRRSGQIAAAVGYDPTAADVQSQVAQLKAAGADTFFVFAFGKFAVQAFLYANKLGWHPQVYVNTVASSANLMTLATITSNRRTTDGTQSLAFVKDPSNPQLAGNPGYRLYLQVMKRYASGANVKDGYYMAGMAAAYALVDILRRAGSPPTRDGVLRAVQSLDLRDPFLIDGIRVRTSATDHFPIEQLQLQRWQNGRWLPSGPLLPAPG